MTNAPRKLIFRFVDPKGRLTVASLIAVAVYLLTFLHVFCAFYYAHRYYDVDERDPAFPVRKELSFPDDEPPDYWDFLYHAFTIAMC